MSTKKSEMVHQVDIMVGHNIKKRRIQLHLSQSRLASNVGLTFQQIQKYESGKNRVSASMLYELARSLRTSIDYFFKTVSEEEMQGILADSGKSDGYVADETTLFTQFMQIRDNKVKESVLDLMRSIVASRRRY